MSRGFVGCRAVLGFFENGDRIGGPDEFMEFPDGVIGGEVLEVFLFRQRQNHFEISTFSGEDFPGNQPVRPFGERGNRHQGRVYS